MSQAVERATQGSTAEEEKNPDLTNLTETLKKVKKIVGPAPVVECKMGGVEIPLLLDSGSQVTIISGTFFNRNLKSQLGSPNEGNKILTLRAANGLTLPYRGYLETEIEVEGQVVKDCGILIQEDLEPITDKKHFGILGTNVLNRIPQYQEWLQKMKSTSKKRIDSAPVRVGGTNQIRVPAESAMDILATGPKYDDVMVVEPLEYPIGGSIAAVSVLVRPECGSYIVRVENRSPSDMWLKPRTVIGTVSEVDQVMENLQLDVTETENEVVVERFTTHPPAPQVKTDSIHCNSVDFKSAPSEPSQQPEDPDAWMNRIKCAQFPEEKMKRIKAVLRKCKDAFALSEDDIGLAKTVEHRIPLKDDKPVSQRCRRVPPAQLPALKEHLKDLLRKGIIRESKSEYASPIVIVQKANGKMRKCVDYRQLNEKIRKDAYPLPRIEECLDYLGKATMFSTMDLKSAYNQVPIAEEDRHKTAFTSPIGLFEYCRVPFGLSTSPAAFQRLISTVFRAEIPEDLIAFQDDIIIPALEFDDMLHLLELALMRLIENGLKVEPEKCYLFMPMVKFLGHQVSEAGVNTDPEKVSAVTDWPTPTSASEVLTFVGKVGYYRRYIKHFSQRAAPLYHLVNLDPNRGKRRKRGRTWKKSESVPFKWDKECQDAFEDLKQTLVTAPILGYPDFQKPFILETDASYKGLGAVLSQQQDGKMRVIAYASRSLRGAEKNHVCYNSMKLELLGLKWAITEKFRDYLLGTTFTVFTDNNPLKYIMTSAKLSAVEQKWVGELSRFNFEIRYRPGKLNQNADALSRRPHPDSDQEEDVDMGIEEVASLMGVTVIPSDLRKNFLKAAVFSVKADVKQIAAEREPPRMDTLPRLAPKELQELQQEDKVMSRVVDFFKKGEKPTSQQLKEEVSGVKTALRQWDRLVLREGVLYRRVTDPKSRVTLTQLLLPTVLKEKTLTALHDKMGHQGTDRTESLVRQRCYWPGMQREIREWVTSCQRCTQAKTPSRQIRTPMKSLSASEPNELVTVDFTVMEPGVGQVENVLVFTDVFSKFSIAIPTRNQTALTTAKAFVREWFLKYGVPCRIHSDQGRNFEADIMKELYKLYGVKQSHSTPYHPIGNGQCERFNRTLHNLLCKLEPEEKRRWNEHLQEVVFFYNATVHPATGYEPFYLMFGRHPNLPIDFLLGKEVEDSHSKNWVTNHKQRLQKAYERAQQNLKQDQAQRKERYDKKTKDWDLDIGQKVYLKDHRPLGRNKIGDYYRPETYLIVNRQGHVYDLEQEGRKSVKKTVNRKEITLVPERQKPIEHKKPHRVTRCIRKLVTGGNELSDSSSSEDENPVGNVELPVDHDSPAGAFMEDSSDEDGIFGVETPSPPLRRSTRPNFGW